jgi:hypothetical protein
MGLQPIAQPSARGAPAETPANGRDDEKDPEGRFKLKLA